MCNFIAVACLIGVYCTSFGTALTVKHGLMTGVKLNESVKEQKHKDNVVIDQYAISDMEPNMESIIHSKHDTGSGQEEDAKIKPGPFSMESFLSLFSEDNDNNEPSSLDGKENQANVSKNEDYEGSVIDEVDIKKQKENTSESEESESNDQQSWGLTPDGFSEQYESPPLTTNIENALLVAEDNAGLADILQETYDENLQNILNITHILDTMKQSIINETHDDLYVGEPSPEDVVDIKDLESTTNIKEDDIGDDSRGDSKIKEEKLIREEKGVKTEIISGDVVIKQKESTTGEQQNQQSASVIKYNRIRGDGADVDNSSEMTTTDQNYGNVDNASSTLASHLKNQSELVRHHNHGADTAILKKGESLEINNMNLSTDPCISFHCKRGKMCKTDGHGNPFCVCQDPDYCLPGNRNDLVCGTDNKTYTSACHLFGTKCHLEGTKEGSHLHLDYQGPCKYIPPCTEYELAYFPFRMRDWLKNVLMQLYERDQEDTELLSDKQKSKVKKIYEDEKRLQEGDHNIELLVKDFQKNYHMYVYPVHWQFHQLDQHLKDKLLTHSELAALRAPLIPIEHCVNTFLQQCNTNNDRHISLWEWCHCFGIKEDDINEDLLF